MGVVVVTMSYLIQGECLLQYSLSDLAVVTRSYPCTRVYLLWACDGSSGTNYVIPMYRWYIYCSHVMGLVVVTISYPFTGGIFITVM